MEAMIAMLLVLTLLGLVSSLMRDFSDVARHSAARDNTMDGVQFALTEMGHELGSAQRVDLPWQNDPPNTTSTVLTFRRIDPSLERFPDDYELTYDSDGEPLMWNTRDPSKWMTVDYRENASGALIRTATPAVGAANTQTMVSKVDSMLVTIVADNFYNLTLSFKEEKGRLRSFTMQARQWIQK